MDGFEPVLNNGLSLQQTHPYYGTVDSGPELTIQSGSDVLECLSLSPTGVKGSKLKGLHNGNSMGFRYSYFTFTTMTHETRKFKIKFRSSAEGGQCASILSRFIECRTKTGAGGTQEHSSDSIQKTADTPATTTSASIPHSSRTASQSQPQQESGQQPVTLENQTQVLSYQTSFMSTSPSQVYGPSTRKMDRQDQVLASQSQPQSTQDVHGQFTSPASITPRYGSQAMPVLSSATASVLVSEPTSVSTMTWAPDGIRSSQDLGQQHPLALTSPLSDIDRWLNIPDMELQNEIDRILQEPTFAELEDE
ncbi:hypothetical protein BGX34_000560 [Mortierella sp. NVP85]|nr:hypothetical protein BGX34_000560 [Mortierella sp. NVP85]